MSEVHKPVSFKLSPSEREAISAALRRHCGPEQRRDKRVDLDDTFQLLVRIGMGQYISVTARDISSSGMGFYHVAYVHPGTEVGLVMKAKGQDSMTRKGAVVRCRHVKGRVHEVGVLFEEPVEVGVVISGSGSKYVLPEPIRKLDPTEVYARISELSVGLSTLAGEKAGLDAILQRVGELAKLLVEQAELGDSEAEAGKKPGPTGAGGAGGPGAAGRH